MLYHNGYTVPPALGEIRGMLGESKSGFFRRFCIVAVAVASLAGLLLLARWLRQLDFLMAAVPFYYLQIVASLLSLIYAAHAAVRFRGTHDRLNLTLAFGFALAGLISTISIFEFYAQITPGDGQAPAPLSHAPHWDRLRRL